MAHVIDFEMEDVTPIYKHSGYKFTFHGHTPDGESMVISNCTLDRYNKHKTTFLVSKDTDNTFENFEQRSYIIVRKRGDDVYEFYQSDFGERGDHIMTIDRVQLRTPIIQPSNPRIVRGGKRSKTFRKRSRRSIKLRKR